MRYILGISAYYHDSAACLFRNEQLVYACEEEKFTGIKHDSSFPTNSINYILRRYKIKLTDIDAVCYYEDPNLKVKRVKNNIKDQWFKNPFYTISSLYNVLKIRRNVKRELSKYSKNIFYSTHHESHLYYSFYTSNFQNAISLSIDGVGEIDTMSMGLCDNHGIDYVSLAQYPHSLGLFYSAMTAFLGFRPNEGEYKLMGLAAYGNPEVYIEKVRELISYKNSDLKCNMDVFCWNRTNRIMFNEKLIELLDLQPRLPEEKILGCHEDLAAAVQKRYEEILFDVIKSISIINDNRNLCLGGGCAYNGSANGKIVKNTHFNNLWIPPAPSDAGSAIGACLHYLSKNKTLKDRVQKNPFLGPNYFYDEYIKNKGLKYFKVPTDSLIRNVAKIIKEGKVVGWYHGNVEFGARALGNRSILADPTNPNMKDRINRLIKKRENFRPFAPMVIKDKQHIFFEVTDDVPYMNQVVKVKSDYIEKLPAVTHVDGTARIQTVYKNTLTYELLLEFEKLTGYPILLNTSMNVKDKTMVLTPRDAIYTFFDTDMDYLVMGNYLIYK